MMKCRGLNDNELFLMNRCLRHFQSGKASEPKKPKYPVLFIVGSPRTGTTYLTQLLINHTTIGYITNFVSRFWDVPSFGIKLQQTLLGETSNPVEYDSSFGATRSPFGPHEFGFFWRRWFTYGESHWIPDNELNNIDVDQLCCEIAAIEASFDAPVFFKNLAACGMNAFFLSEVLPSSIFIVCRRNINDIANSILKARIEREGSASKWFSIRPPEYGKLTNLKIEEQITGQIYGIERHLYAQLKKIDYKRWWVLDFERLIQHPEQVIEKIVDVFQKSITQEKQVKRKAKNVEKHIYRFDKKYNTVLSDLNNKADELKASNDWNKLFVDKKIQYL